MTKCRIVEEIGAEGEKPEAHNSLSSLQQGWNFCIFGDPGSEPKKIKEPKKLEVKRGERGEKEREGEKRKRGGKTNF